MPTQQKQDGADALIKAIADYAAMTGQTGDRRSNTYMNLGGLGVWMATTACFVMLTAMFVGGLWMSSIVSRADTDYQFLRMVVRDHIDRVEPRPSESLRPAESKPE